MAFDGLFIHHLINEIKNDIIDKRINKFLTVNDTDFLLQLSNKKNLFITLNRSSSYFCEVDCSLLQSQSHLTNFIKKHLEGGIIKDISQYNNDRIVTISILSSDDFGYKKKYYLILELTGKNSNLIITDEDFVIVEALKKSYLTDDRIIQVKAKYSYLSSNLINPFLSSNEIVTNKYEGISKTVHNEIDLYGVIEVINRPTKPTLFIKDKLDFYCFDLFHLDGERKEYESLSSLVCDYYKRLNLESVKSMDELNAYNHITKTLSKLNTKLSKQENELQSAYDNLSLKETASLLAANIHLVKPYQDSITVKNFYNNDTLITIPLNTKISVNENVNYYFDKYKKSKRAVEEIKKTIQNTKNDILYYEDMLSQLSFVQMGDLKELMVEIGIKKPLKMKQKINILTYNLKDGSIIMVGKNNIQNNYLTHTLAKKDDYFFHVKNVPGSHVIFRGTLTNENIAICGAVASFYSKLNKSINVCVDYTLVKWVKKIPGMKGSFVSYTHEKNVFSNPSLDFINKSTSTYK